MARKDRIEDELAWLRITYALALASDVSLIGWFAVNYATISVVLVVLAVVASFVLQALLAALIYAALARQNELENI